MQKTFLSRGLKISFKKFLAVTLLFSPSLAWFYVIRENLLILQEKIITQTANLDIYFDAFFCFYISIAFSVLLGSVISERVNRKKYLGIWILFGVLVNFLLIFVQDYTLFQIFSILSGISFGFGFSSCVAFIADATNIEERGRISGLVILFTYGIAIFIFSLSFAFQLTLTESIIIALVLRASSFLALVLDPFERIEGKKISWFGILNTKGFIYYFTSWLFFIVADGISVLFENWLPESVQTASIMEFGGMISYLGIVFSSLISGFTSDKFGRKKTIIFGLSVLGISYAFFAVITSAETYLITMLIYGAAWGIIIVNYFITIIGDFAKEGSKEKFYTLGAIMPFILLLSVDLFTDILDLSAPTSLFSSILSMLLFVSIIPLIYAPETLPSEKIKKRKMEEYVERVGKIIHETEEGK